MIAGALPAALLAGCGRPVAVASAPGGAWGAAPLAVVLSAEGSEGEAFSWDLGDGTRAEGAEVRHTYADPGVYVASLEVRDGAASDRAEVVVSVAEGPCPAFAEPVLAGEVASDVLDEASGLLVGRADAGVLWAHDDAGGGPTLHALGPAGEDLGSVTLSGASNVDWEDLAWGPLPGGGSGLYVGDIGNNDLDRSEAVLYRLPEPAAPGGEAAVAQVEARIALRWPGGFPVDAEALVVDPVTGEAVLLGRRRDGVVPVYRGAAAEGVFRDGEAVDLEVVDTLDADGILPGGGDPRAAALSADGGVLAVRTEGAIVLWERDPARPVWESFALPGCPVPAPAEPRPEALALAADGSALYTLGEGAHPPLHRVERLDR